MQTGDSFFERKKNEFLAALYVENYEAAEQSYLDVLKKAESRPFLSENNEKYLNQIRAIFKRFSNAILENSSLNIRAYDSRLKRLILDSLKKSSKNIRYIDFDTWEKKLGLSSAQKRILFKTAFSFQLTSGCSNYCRRCNEWALPKIRAHFSYDAVLEIMDRFESQRNRDISLYGASDPLDWEQDGKTIYSVLKTPYALNYSLLTKIPKGKEALLKKILEKNLNISVSMTSMNEKRIKRIERELGVKISKQHKLDELLIPARLDEDFVSVKPSITDGYGSEITPDGAFIIIPAFTSPLNLLGHKKIPVTKKTRFFPVKKTGRQALPADYFKPVEVYDIERKVSCLKYLLDVQTESVVLDNGSEELTPPGMRGIKEYLSIFEEKARLQRKRILPSVIKRLKKRLSDRDLSEKERYLYLGRIKSHIEFCEKDISLVSKIYAVSFLLESVMKYLKRNPVKGEMLSFLLKDEKDRIFSKYGFLENHNLLELLRNESLDSFDIFRLHVFMLLERSVKENTLFFIESSKAEYDKAADRFVRKP